MRRRWPRRSVRDPLCLRGDLHQSAGARAGFRHAARGDRSRARATAPALQLVLDTTIASPWAFKSAALAQRRRHHRRQRHQVAGRQRSRPVGLPRDQRYAVRQCGDGSDRHARRHSRLAARRGDSRGVRRRGDSHARRSASAAKVAAFLASHPEGERGLSSLAARPSRRGRHRRKHYVVTARCSLSGIKGADEERTRHFADVLATR